MNNKINNLPQGSIIAWSPLRIKTSKVENKVGSLQVPDGWVVCNGENNTPDLRNKFIMGASSISEINSSSGAEKHTHIVTTGAADNKTDPARNPDLGTKHILSQPSHKHSGTAQGGSSIPPNIRLVYIMKNSE